MTGIIEGFIAAFFYDAGKKALEVFQNPFQNAINQTITHFVSKGIVLDSSKFELLLKGEIGQSELEKFHSGRDFINGDKLALQFSIFGGLSLEDESQRLNISNEIFSFFREALTKELIKNKKVSLETIGNILNIFSQKLELLQINYQLFQEEVKKFISEELSRQLSLKSAVKKSIEKIFLEDYKIINENFWETIKGESDLQNLVLYYTRTDSSQNRLFDVVANDYYVLNKSMEDIFDNQIKSVESSKVSLIKIISRGGEGKSTFLLHVAKKYQQNFTPVFLEKLSLNVLEKVYDLVNKSDLNKPVLLLVDNIAIHSEDLIEITPKLVKMFRGNGLIVVVSERDFRYQNIESINEFENNFNIVSQLNFRSTAIKELILDKLISILSCEYKIEDEIISQARLIYLENNKKSISESTYSLLKFLRNKAGIKFVFDWEDWYQFAKQTNPNLQRLFLVLSTFFQFGFSLEIEFCSRFLKDLDAIDLLHYLSESRNNPIHRKGDHLFLRHETIAEWFFDEDDFHTKANKIASEAIFQEFLKKIDNRFGKDLLIWLTKNKDFNESYLSKFINTSKKIELLHSFIVNNKSELKCRTELAKLYQLQGKDGDAEKILNELLDIDKHNLHARTELAKIYQRQGKLEEAEKILYQLLRLEKNSFFAMAELISIFNKKKLVDRCITEFEDFLRKAKPTKERAPQAMFNNIFRFCKRFNMSHKAQEYYKTYENILDERNKELYDSLFNK